MPEARGWRWRWTALSIWLTRVPIAATDVGIGCSRSPATWCFASWRTMWARSLTRSLLAS